MKCKTTSHNFPQRPTIRKSKCALKSIPQKRRMFLRQEGAAIAFNEVVEPLQPVVVLAANSPSGLQPGNKYVGYWEGKFSPAKMRDPKIPGKMVDNDGTGGKEALGPAQLPNDWQSSSGFKNNIILWCIGALR